MAECQTCGSDEEIDELQACPYDVDINGDDTPTCNCCNECAGNCAMEI